MDDSLDSHRDTMLITVISVTVLSRDHEYKNTTGFAELMRLQDTAEETITHDPDFLKSMQSTLWDVYRHGENVGMIWARLDIANMMRKTGHSRTLIHQLTQVPEADLEL